MNVKGIFVALCDVQKKAFMAFSCVVRYQEHNAMNVSLESPDYSVLRDIKGGALG